jgi:hypothetical protein
MVSDGEFSGVHITLGREKRTWLYTLKGILANQKGFGLMDAKHRKALRVDGR